MANFNTKRDKNRVADINAGGIPKNNQANKAWKKVESYLKECLMLGFVVAAVAHLIINYFPEWPVFLFRITCNMFGERVHPTDDILTCFLFFVIADIAIVPVYFVRSLRNFTGTGISIVKELNFIKRLGLTAGCLFMAIGFPLAPYIVLINGHGDSNWRVKGVFDLVTTSYLGVSVIGGVLVWASFVGMLALAIIPLLWAKH